MFLQLIFYIFNNLSSPVKIVNQKNGKKRSTSTFLTHSTQPPSPLHHQVTAPLSTSGFPHAAVVPSNTSVLISWTPHDGSTNEWRIRSPHLSPNGWMKRQEVRGHDRPPNTPHHRPLCRTSNRRLPPRAVPGQGPSKGKDNIRLYGVWIRTWRLLYS